MYRFLNLIDFLFGVLNLQTSDCHGRRPESKRNGNPNIF